MPIGPGVRFGSYEILEAVGAGGMGEVFRARDTRLNRIVAIKFLSDAIASASARRRFQPAFLSMWWLLRVRRVVIRRDVVLISRGLRPMPRRYARPEYGRVVRVDKAVYVGKVGSSGLMNPSASPILRSEDEAKWIAAEIRRALRQTSRQ